MAEFSPITTETGAEGNEHDVFFLIFFSRALPAFAESGAIGIVRKRKRKQSTQIIAQRYIAERRQIRRSEHCASDRIHRTGRADSSRANVEERYSDAMRELGALSGPVDRFFADVLVMARDPALKAARLILLSTLRRTILDIADIAEIAEETKPA